ncbi:DUF190 domain-containing protein [Polaromonas sp.]|uniref:DUF190 domain-containing protein n=1 Tax=Polaromonas sp. TaxID=1869339 RepID=UPI002FC7BD5A
MQGYQLTFFTQQDRRIHGKPLAEWLLTAARDMGIRGGTVVAASQGLGHDRRLHSAHFVDLADQPVEITFAVSQAESDQLLALMAQQEGRVFYVKAPVEFGSVGQAAD